MDVTDDERDLLLAALFRLSITRAEDPEIVRKIEVLVVKLGGDPDTALFGAYRHDPATGVPVPEYPADETDEG